MKTTRRISVNTTYDFKEHVLAEITVNKNRRPKYDKNIIYLKDGTEFEIELSNNTRGTVLARIKLDDNLISASGIVLKPGEHVFLDRYLEDQRKFIFNTYNIEAKNEQSKEAIKNNGNVEIIYYKEQVPDFPITWIGGTHTFESDWFNNHGTTNKRGLLFERDCGTGGTLTTNTSFSASSLSQARGARVKATVLNDSISIGDKVADDDSGDDLIETGRVEMGGTSKQEFTNAYNKFNSYSFETIRYKLLPESEKLLTVNDSRLRRYCTSCSRKIHPKWTYCSGCGTKV
jgi:hypothetical protein